MKKRYEKPGGGGGGKWETIASFTTKEEMSIVEFTEMPDGTTIANKKFTEITAFLKVVGVSTNGTGWVLMKVKTYQKDSEIPEVYGNVIQSSFAGGMIKSGKILRNERENHRGKGDMDE